MKDIVKNDLKNTVFLFKFINLYFFKSLFGPIVCFILTPLISIGFIYLNKDYVSTILPSALSNVIIIVPFILIISSMIEIKKNSIVEKYFLFARKPFFANIIPFVYFLVVLIVSFLFNLLIIYLVSFDKQTFKNDIFVNANFGHIIYIMLLSILFILSIVALLYTFIKSLILSQIISFVLLLFFMMFSGNFIPWYTIVNNQFLNGISYLSPLRYINIMFIESINSISDGISNLNNTNIFDFVNPYAVKLIEIDTNANVASKDFIMFKDYDQILNFVITLIAPIVLSSISLNIRQGKRK